MSHIGHYHTIKHFEYRHIFIWTWSLDMIRHLIISSLVNKQKQDKINTVVIKLSVLSDMSDICIFGPTLRVNCRTKCPIETWKAPFTFLAIKS